MFQTNTAFIWFMTIKKDTIEQVFAFTSAPVHPTSYASQACIPNLQRNVTLTAREPDSAQTMHTMIIMLP